MNIPNTGQQYIFYGVPPFNPYGNFCQLVDSSLSPMTPLYCTLMKASSKQLHQYIVQYPDDIIRGLLHESIGNLPSGHPARFSHMEVFTLMSKIENAFLKKMGLFPHDFLNSLIRTVFTVFGVTPTPTAGKTCYDMKEYLFTIKKWFITNNFPPEFFSYIESAEKGVPLHQWASVITTYCCKYGRYDLLESLIKTDKFTYDLPEDLKDFTESDDFIYDPIQYLTISEKPEGFKIINLLKSKGRSHFGWVVGRKKPIQTLHLACEYQRYNFVEIFLKCNGLNYNALDSKGKTPLMRAAKKGNPDVVKLLLNLKKIDLKVKQQFQNAQSGSTSSDLLDTPLAIAIKNGHAHLIAPLVVRDPTILNLPDILGSTPLHEAVWIKDPDNRSLAIGTLVKLGADRFAKDSLGNTPLSLLYENGYAEGILEIFGEGDDAELYASVNNCSIFDHCLFKNHLRRFLPTIISRVLALKGPVRDIALTDFYRAVNVYICTSDSMLPSQCLKGIAQAFQLNFSQDLLGLSQLKGHLVNIAANYLSADCIEELFRSGYPFNIPDSNGCLPIVRLIELGYLPLASKLIPSNYCFIEQRSPNKENLMHLALRSYNDTNIKDVLDLIKTIIEANKQGIPIVEMLNEPNADGITPLHAACLIQDMDAVLMLIEAGAKVNFKTKDNSTMLHVVCGLKSGNYELVEYLKGKCDPKCDPDALNDNGITPFLLACQHSMDIRIPLLLLRSGACVTIPTPLNKITALHLLSLHDQDFEQYGQLLDEMVLAGATVNAKDKNGLTPLHYALMGLASPEIVSKLIDLGADLTLKATNGVTVLHLMCLHSKYSHLIEKAILKGADPYAEDESEEKFQPLDYAMRVEENNPPNLFSDIVGQFRIRLEAFLKAGIKIRKENIALFKCIIDSRDEGLLRLAIEALELDDEYQVKSLLTKAFLYATTQPSLPIEFIRVLIDKGADINAQDPVDGSTWLHRECLMHDNAPRIREIILLGADLNIPYGGNNPRESWKTAYLMILEKYTTKPSLRGLAVRKKGNPNFTDKQKNNLLYHTMKRFESTFDLKDLVLAELLIELDAKLESPVAGGGHPIHILCKSSVPWAFFVPSEDNTNTTQRNPTFESFRDLVVDSITKENINLKDSHGVTPFLYLCRYFQD